MANPHLDLLLQLMGATKQRLGARPSPQLNEYVRRRIDPTLAENPFPEVNPPLEGPGYMNAPSPEAKTPISRDPWFDEDPKFDEMMTSQYIGDPMRQIDELQPDEQPRPPVGSEEFDEFVPGVVTESPPMGGAEWAKQRAVLVSDMMRSLGIEPRGSYDRYYSQLLHVDDAFIKRIAQKLELNEDMTLTPNGLRSLLATEFEAFGTNI